MDIKIKVLKSLIRHPQTKRRLEVGKTMVVPSNSYWLRRLRDGDIEKVVAKAAEPEQPKMKKSSAKLDDKKNHEVSK